MTTTDTQVPAWLNLDAFDLPEDKLDELRQTVIEVRKLVTEVDHVLASAARLDMIIDDRVHGHDIDTPDDVSEAVFNLTGRAELWELLGVVAHMVGDITGSGGFGNDEFYAKARARFGLTAEWPDLTYPRTPEKVEGAARKCAESVSLVDELLGDDK